MLVEAFGFVSIVFFLVYLACRNVNRWRGLPPGPTPLPLLGNILSLDVEMDKVFLKWKKKYGKIFTVWMPYPTIVINDHEVLKATIVAQGDAYGGRHPPEQFMKLLVGGNYGLVLNENDMWKEQRRFALQSLRDQGFGTNSMQDTINFLAHREVEVLRAFDGEVVDMAPHYTSCVANVVTSLLFGKIGEHDDADIQKFKEVFSGVFDNSGTPLFMALEFIPALLYFDSLLGIGVKHTVEQNNLVMEYLDKEVVEHEAAFDPEHPPKCYVDAYLHEMHRRKTSGEDLASFTRHQLIVAAYDIYAAGLETTVTSLRYATHYLINYPHVQEMVHREIDKKIGKRDARMEDQRDLPYTSAFIQELQRVGNFLPMNFARMNMEPVVIEGYSIPAGNAFIPQFHSVHLDPDLYPRPYLFCPERHLNEAGEFVKDPRITPFSVGKRSCLGEALARMEVFIFFVTFMQHFRFAPEGIVPPKLELVPGFLRTPKPFKCRIFARKE